MGKKSAYCTGCKYQRDCGGFHDRAGRCPEWVINERKRATLAVEIARLEAQYKE